MATLKAVKKKLSGICSIQKFTKAMKNIATMKYVRLNTAFSSFAKYKDQFVKLYEKFPVSYDKYLAISNPSAPACLVVMAANRGMCGAFNSSILGFVEETLSKAPKPYLTVLCGAKAKSFFEEKGFAYEKLFVFPDIPKYEDAVPLFDFLKSNLKSGKISFIRLACTKYTNLLSQTPVLKDFPYEPSSIAKKKDEESLFFPDKESVIKSTVDGILNAFVYEALLESALCVQASSLLAMRSSYETSSEYRVSLEKEINRMRQSKITADVIETSAEHVTEES